MKKFLVFLSAIFICTFAIAHSIEWYVDGSLYQTTTCNSGDSVTPPTAPEKYGYHFVEWTGYIQLEYIESTGTQWIDTGYKFTGTTSIIEAGIVFTSASTDWKTLSATQSDTNTRWGGIQFKGSKVYAAAGNLTGDNGAQLLVTTNTRYNIKVETNVSTGKNKLTVNDATDTVDFGGSCYTDKNLLLSAKSATSISEYVSIKLYSYKLTIDNVLVRNFIPARRAYDNAIGMYDTVTQTFFTNQGTGEFIEGPEVGGL